MNTEFFERKLPGGLGLEMVRTRNFAYIDFRGNPELNIESSSWTLDAKCIPGDLDEIGEILAHLFLASIRFKLALNPETPVSMGNCAISDDQAA